MRKEPYAAARARAEATHDIPAAEAEQARLAALVHIPPDTTPHTLPATVAGLDISYEVGSERVVAAAVLVDTATLVELGRATLFGTQTFPYVPGLLAFREVPLLLAALEELYTAAGRAPDMLLCDGQGIAHPARCGLASHLGVLTGLPSVGCAKSHYVGAYVEPGERRGERSEMVDRGEVVGHVLRTQTGVKPVFVSPGHRVGRAEACEVVLALCGKYRVPEPVRFADQVSRKMLRETR
ncbi:hypothetical protein CspeluHIS016_0108510 [Cutaneotrichosporon spelunceum]|uniref:Endonuclease V n=1 Tax=Cutaneotrichosporon spelunceum TaxID=1672016 RepID=A0AAD3TQ09_9TREE|nr:hypothetical protein CspeluHIS016_0108510 [Cutaneotrichosporon spelunceum]